MTKEQAIQSFATGRSREADNETTAIIERVYSFPGPKPKAPQ